MKYAYFIPTIHLGPIRKTKFTLNLPLNRIEQLIIGKTCVLEVIILVISQGNVVFESKSFLKFLNGTWVDRTGEKFQWTNNLDNDLCYVETQVNTIEGIGLNDHFLPGFYVFYTSKLSKTYLSCLNWKYGNPRVVMQMAEFGQWSDGYPCINIDKEIGATYSIVIINPYEISTNFIINISDFKISLPVKVKPKSIKRMDIADLVKIDKWTGQIYIYGKRRAVIYFVHHKTDDFSDIVTIEHSDPFRAERNSSPRFQYLRNRVHKFLKKI
jgi:hypothetical protein